jgi:GTP-binding protein Era
VSPKKIVSNKNGGPHKRTGAFKKATRTKAKKVQPAALESAKIKTGYVALVGRPNVGKSTLLNRLLGQKVAIVSDKPQTTRLSILGIKTTDRGQIVFIDNPGIHKPLHKLNKRMMSFVYSALETADVIGLLIDATMSFGHGDEFVLETLRQVTKPVFLLINKVDIIRKDRILLIIDKYKDLFPFKEIIPISALSGANLDALEKCLYDHLPAAEKIYGDQELSDQSERFLLAELIREKVLTHVAMELPFVTAVYIDQVERRAERETAGPKGEQAGLKDEAAPAEAEKRPLAGTIDLASEKIMAATADRLVKEHMESIRSGPKKISSTAQETEPAPRLPVHFPEQESSPLRFRAYDSHQTIRTGLPVQSSFRPDKRFKGKKARQSLPVTYVKASIFVERPNHRQIIIGRQGHLIRLIGTEARRDMEQYLDSRVYLDLQVKVRPNWRDSADVLDLIEGQK